MPIRKSGTTEIPRLKDQSSMEILKTLTDSLKQGCVCIDHSTIYRWVQKYTPEMKKRMRWQWRRPMSDSWRVDKTYIKVRSKGTYLYRAVDKLGSTIDFYLSSTRSETLPWQGASCL